MRWIASLFLAMALLVPTAAPAVAEPAVAPTVKCSFMQVRAVNILMDRVEDYVMMRTTPWASVVLSASTWYRVATGPGKDNATQWQNLIRLGNPSNRDMLYQMSATAKRKGQRWVPRFGGC